MKKCYTCKESKFCSEFNKNVSRKDGLNSICKICSQKRSKQYYLENREKHISEISARKFRVIEENKRFIFDVLSSSCCIDCGFSDPRALEFDHVKEVKRAALSELLSHGCSLATIKLEIAKCEIRCANCHRIKTSIDYDWYKNRFFMER